mmetsp:Transcript_14988/g.47818  ORF Transcript_14988/g.47818 Transcript_14988/m.47818 type:complete len:260 (+) Transcript_14988:487-1266(+)
MQQSLGNEQPVFGRARPCAGAPPLLLCSHQLLELVHECHVLGHVCGQDRGHHNLACTSSVRLGPVVKQRRVANSLARRVCVHLLQDSSVVVAHGELCVGVDVECIRARLMPHVVTNSSAQEGHLLRRRQPAGQIHVLKAHCTGVHHLEAVLEVVVRHVTVLGPNHANEGGKALVAERDALHRSKVLNGRLRRRCKLTVRHGKHVQVPRQLEITAFDMVSRHRSCCRGRHALGGLPRRCVAARKEGEDAAPNVGAENAVQ